MLPTTLPRLERPPVRLRGWEQSDADVVRSVAADPLIPLITTVPASGSDEDVKAYIGRQRRRLADGVSYSFAIADHDSDEAVGHIGAGLRNVDQGRVSLGYWIGPRFRREGYAGTALAALSDWVLDLPDVHRAELYVEPWNEGSWRTAEAAGFEREGLLRRWERVGDTWRDMYMYSRLADVQRRRSRCSRLAFTDGHS